MQFKLRFLLTGKCTARCAYCHNEGQGKQAGLLQITQIHHFLGKLAAVGIVADEIVLSGGEPTLHKHLGEIARLCRSHTQWLSMDSHAGHPRLLQAALPYLDELKLHIDSFDPAQQYASMGIAIAAVEESIHLAQQFPGLRLVSNHPLNNVRETTAFLHRARELGIDCKVIEMFAQGKSCQLLPAMHWENLGYRQCTAGVWEHQTRQHRIYTKRCGQEHNPINTLFIGADGIRQALDTPAIGQIDTFDPGMLMKTCVH